MAARRRRFTAEFKRKAVRLAQRPNGSKAKVARELGLNPSVLSKWVRQFASGKRDNMPKPTVKSDHAKELVRVLEELTQVKIERDILERVIVYLLQNAKQSTSEQR